MRRTRTALAVWQEVAQHLRSCGAAVTLLLMMATSPASAQEAVEYYGMDALGSVRVVYDTAGAEVRRTDYLPYGEELTSSAGLPAKRFTGQERDAEAALDYFHARMYQSRSGRFNTVDPVYAGLLDAQQWNRYAYVRNSPLNAVDPSGLLVWSCYGYTYTDPETHSSGWIPRYCDALDFGSPGPPALIHDDQEPAEHPGADSPPPQTTTITTATPTSPTTTPTKAPQQATQKLDRPSPQDRPNVPPTWEYCKSYQSDGTGAGQTLARICMAFPDNRWSNCVRGELLDQYVPNGDPLDLSIYLFWDHAKDFVNCARR